MSSLIPVITIGLIAALSPPAHYDYEPEWPPYSVVEQPFMQIQVTCEGTYVKYLMESLGCVDTNERVIYLPEEYDAPMRDLIFRHERAHLNGWRH